MKHEQLALAAHLTSTCIRQYIPHTPTTRQQTALIIQSVCPKDMSEKPLLWSS